MRKKEPEWPIIGFRELTKAVEFYTDKLSFKYEKDLGLVTGLSAVRYFWRWADSTSTCIAILPA
jgi:hypothetical protein